MSLIDKCCLANRNSFSFAEIQVVQALDTLPQTLFITTNEILLSKRSDTGDNRLSAHFRTTVTRKKQRSFTSFFLSLLCSRRKRNNANDLLYPFGMFGVSNVLRVFRPNAQTLSTTDTHTETRTQTQTKPRMSSRACRMYKQYHFNDGKPQTVYFHFSSVRIPGSHITQNTQALYHTYKTRDTNARPLRNVRRHACKWEFIVCMYMFRYIYIHRLVSTQLESYAMQTRNVYERAA